MVNSRPIIPPVPPVVPPPVPVPPVVPPPVPVPPPVHCRPNDNPTKVGKIRLI